MKRLFTFFFALLSVCTFSTYAAIIDGTCGTNLTWTLNTKDSTLVISGEGEMTSTPWSDYKIYIKYVTLLDGLTSIGTGAFSGCSKLTSITIPNSVTSIGYWAFEDCSGLTSITIPNSVTSIGQFAFDGCSALTKTNYTGDVAAWCDIKFVSYCANPIYYSNNFYINDQKIKDLSIPNSVTSIGSCAFAGCKGLTSVTIGNSVTSIGSGAFYECSSLTSITIPNSVTSIGIEAFDGCSGLTSITIPNSVTSIGIQAFANCSRLTSVTLGKNLTSIGDDAFSSCSKIREVTAYMPIPPNAIKCGLNPAAATLYVPAEYVGIYSNSVWWEDFKEIRAIDADYVVTFVDWDGTVLASVGVAAGQAATAPADPVREGYTFIGWDSDFSSVMGDMTITAQYQINRYQVRFYDWNETLLKTDSVDYRSAATAPADPTREGYTFIGWDKDFSSITADLDVYAQYEECADKEFEVVFSDQDNNELFAQSITLYVPRAPEIEGFIFLYWQPVAAPLDDVITIQAVYGSNTPTEAPEVFVNPSNPAQKLIRNGQVYILQEDKMYTISGQVVK